MRLGHGEGERVRAAPWSRDSKAGTTRCCQAALGAGTLSPGSGHALELSSTSRKGMAGTRLQQGGAQRCHQPSAWQQSSQRMAAYWWLSPEGSRAPGKACRWHRVAGPSSALGKLCTALGMDGTHWKWGPSWYPHVLLCFEHFSLPSSSPAVCAFVILINDGDGVNFRPHSAY